MASAHRKSRLTAVQGAPACQLLTGCHMTLPTLLCVVPLSLTLLAGARLLLAAGPVPAFGRTV
jgi:hypothetical protein